VDGFLLYYGPSTKLYTGTHDFGSPAASFIYLPLPQALPRGEWYCAIGCYKGGIGGSPSEEFRIFNP
jgi:hypothetical protein